MKPIKPPEPMERQSIIYIGPSMNPTLAAGDRLQIVPYEGRKIRRGDVIVFLRPGGDTKIIHRVVSSNLSGIRTRGDNNNRMDTWLLKHDEILGRVFSAQRGNRQRRVLGGLLGRLVAAKVRVIHAMDSRVSYLLRPAYNELAKVGIFTRLLPAQMRPRVISFARETGTELQLVMGRKVIGRRLEGKTGWYIKRPFRLFVDEASLPENPGKGSVVPPEADPLLIRTYEGIQIL